MEPEPEPGGRLGPAMLLLLDVMVIVAVVDLVEIEGERGEG